MIARFIVPRGLGLVARALGLVLAVAVAAPAAAAERLAEPALRSCPRHGAGFVKAPGSDTCIRLSGRVAADLIARDRRDRTAPVVAPTGRIAIDTRTETEYGPVRTFVRTGTGRR